MCSCINGRMRRECCCFCCDVPLTDDTSKGTGAFCCIRVASRAYGGHGDDAFIVKDSTHTQAYARKHHQPPNEIDYVVDCMYIVGNICFHFVKGEQVYLIEYTRFIFELKIWKVNFKFLLKGVWWIKNRRWL